jgi:hypothetical protein
VVPGIDKREEHIDLQRALAKQTDDPESRLILCKMTAEWLGLAEQAKPNHCLPNALPRSGNCSAFRLKCSATLAGSDPDAF